jgi:hypothetical protein
MNQFLEKFSTPIKSFWETGSEQEKQKLLTDILQYANTNPEKFKQELQEVQFDKELTPLAVVLEALSKDTDKWGQFYVDTLDKIFEQAKVADKPHDILSCLMEFAYIEKDNSPFVQRIVDRLNKETDSDNVSVKLAAIWTLPAYLKNPSIRDKSSITNSLQQKLHDKNWKVRYVAFKSLGYEDMLPDGHKLSMGDQIRKLIFGVPPTI